MDIETLSHVAAAIALLAMPTMLTWSSGVSAIRQYRAPGGRVDGVAVTMTALSAATTAVGAVAAAHAI